MNIIAPSAEVNLSLMCRVYLLLRVRNAPVVGARILTDSCRYPIYRRNSLIDRVRPVVAEKNAVKNRRAQLRDIVAGAKHKEGTSSYGTN